MDLHIAHATININPPPGASALSAWLHLPVRTASEPAQAGAALTPPTAGERWPGQGGFFVCTLPAIAHLPARHLIVSEAEADAITWGEYDDIPGAKSRIDGSANTLALLAHGKTPAAEWASKVTADGNADFYLPSQLELFMASLYAPALFKKEGWYWTSSQYSRSYAFVQVFEDGYSGWYGKGSKFRARAVRRIQLQHFNA